VKRVVTLSVVCLLACAGLLIWGFANTAAPKSQGYPPEVLLLVEDDTGSFPMQLKKGLQEAVQSLGGRLSVETLSAVPPNAPDEAFLPYDAVYLLMADPKALLDRLSGLAIPAILLNEEIRGENGVIFGEEEGALQLGLMALGQKYSGSLHVLVDQDDPRQSLRLKGLMTAFEGHKILLHAPGSVQPKQLQNAVCIFALSGRMMEQAAAWKAAGLLPLTLPLYGFEGEDSRVRLMEEGLVQAVAVSSPYAMGYTAGNMLRLMQNGELKPSVSLVSLRLVTPETLYDADNVKEMFPLLQ
jgi:hypothetical protein